MTAERPAPRFPTAADVLSGETADVYLERARTILAAEQLDPVVTMEVFSRGDGVLCGAEEAHAYLRQIFSEVNGTHAPVVESLHDGDRFGPKEVVMRVEARYSAFGLVRDRDPRHPRVRLGLGERRPPHRGRGCADPGHRIRRAPRASERRRPDGLRVGGGRLHRRLHAAGARLAGLAPTGTMPMPWSSCSGHGPRRRGLRPPHRSRGSPHLLVDTFKDEAEESLRVAEALGDRLWGVRLDTPSERGPSRRAREGGPRAARPGGASEREIVVKDGRRRQQHGISMAMATTIFTFGCPARSSRARTSFTSSGATPPRSDGASSRTPQRRSPSASATRSDSSASSLRRRPG